jgi:hypothetical protein
LSSPDRFRSWTRYNGGTFDTRDWQIAGGVVNATQVIANFDQILDQAPDMDTGYIVLEHDLYQQSTELAVNYVLPRALASPSLSLQTIVECLGEDLSQAYVETRSNQSTGAVPTTPIVGASDTGLVQGLSVTPVAIGGDYTGAGSTIGGTAQPTGAANTGGSSQNAADGESSGAVGLSTSFALLFLTACGMLALA